MELGSPLGIAFYVCAVAAFLLLAEFCYLGIVAPLQRRRAINRRLGAQLKSEDNEQALNLLKSQRGVLDGDVRLMRGIRRLLVQSGLRLTVSQFLMLAALAAVSIAGGLMLMTALPVLVCVPIGAALGGLIPVLVLSYVRNRRQLQFMNQLPDALDIVIRGLRSGHPVQSAMLYVGREMPDPIGSEFGMTVDEITFGLGMEQALHNLSGRVGVPELSFLVTATAIQGKTGGNLAEVLEGLSTISRDRFQLKRKVRAMSSEGRMSAYALTIMPLLIALVIHLQNPSYFGDVWDEPGFRLMLLGLGIWQLFGYVIMLKMINFKI